MKRKWDFEFSDGQILTSDAEIVHIDKIYSVDDEHFELDIRLKDSTLVLRSFSSSDLEDERNRLIQWRKSLKKWKEDTFKFDSGFMVSRDFEMIAISISEQNDKYLCQITGSKDTEINVEFHTYKEAESQVDRFLLWYNENYQEKGTKNRGDE